MAGLRLPGPLNLLNLDGLSGVLQLRPGDSPAPVGASPEAAQPARVNRGQRLPAWFLETNRQAREGARPITFRELVRGVQLSVWDMTGAPRDPNTWDWRVPFRTVRADWIMEARPLDLPLKAVRDRFIDLLKHSLLASHISGMLRRTKEVEREHKAYITADGNIGGMMRGSRNEVEDLDLPDGVSPIAVVHTHQWVPRLQPPSLVDDFRRNMLQLVAEYAQGRLWIAASPNLALLIGQIVVGVCADRDLYAHFRPIAHNDPHRDIVFHMSPYIRAPIPPPQRTGFRS